MTYLEEISETLKNETKEDCLVFRIEIANHLGEMDETRYYFKTMCGLVYRLKEEYDSWLLVLIAPSMKKSDSYSSIKSKI